MSKQIIATDETFIDIMNSEIARLGYQADLNHVDVSRVTDMGRLFQLSKFNGNISKWDVSNVKYMERMFIGSHFNGDISEWNVSNVECMYDIFRESQFNGDISKWAVRDDCDVKHALTDSPALTSPIPGKLHFMAKAQDESIVLHPDAEEAYAKFMPIAKPKSRGTLTITRLP